MEEQRTTTGRLISSLTRIMVFAAMLALPFANMLHITSYMLLGLALLVLVTGKAFKADYKWLIRQPLFLLFGLYYVLQVIAFIRYPEANRGAIDQKASLIVLPLLFYILITHYRTKIWRTAVAGLLCGITAASLLCLGFAAGRYLQAGDTQAFFYHTYAGTVQMSAIYFSLYLLIGIIYLLQPKILSGTVFTHAGLRLFLITFFLFNLVLLSSKLMVAAGIILLLVHLFRSVHSRLVRFTAFGAFAVGITVLFLTSNPVTERYKDLDLGHYSIAFDRADYEHYPFDGLNLRLLLWRMGVEEANERNTWLAGNGGKHYHQDLNSRIRSYNMYTGDAEGKSEGYLNYNMHNQYMESFAQFGIAGIATLAGILALAAYQAFRYHIEILKYTVPLFAVLFLTESVLERQLGIILFTLIITSEWILLHRQRRSGI